MIATPKGERPAAHEFAIAQAEFKRLQFTLIRLHRTIDGKTAFAVSRWARSHAFSDWSQVLAFLLQAGRAA